MALYWNNTAILDMAWNMLSILIAVFSFTSQTNGKLSSFENMSHILDLMLQVVLSTGRHVPRGVWGCSCILEGNAFLISDVNLWRSKGFSFLGFLLPQICSSVDLPVCSQLCRPRPASPPHLCGSMLLSVHISAKERGRENNRRSGARTWETNTEE